VFFKYKSVFIKLIFVFLYGYKILYNYIEKCIKKLQLFKELRKESVILNECIAGRDTELQCKHVKFFLKTTNLRTAFFIKIASRSPSERSI
jgi:hypothetical protein